MMWYRETPFVLGDQKQAHLQVRGLSAGYGAFLVLRELRFEVKPGLTVVLGPNGAGKTTLLKALMGLIPRSGMVLLDGQDLPEKTHEIVLGGVTLVAEGRQLFPQMSVLENLELGAWLLSASPTAPGSSPLAGASAWLAAARRALGAKAERARRIEQVLNDFPKLRERLHQLAGTMSGGEQQMVAVARAMMSAPRLLMLDEPSLGLAPRMVDELLAITRRIADAGTTVLMVEQNVKKALAVADRGYVLERGSLVASGPARLLERSNVVREAYLGAHAADTTTAADALHRRRKSSTQPG